VLLVVESRDQVVLFGTLSHQLSPVVDALTDVKLTKTSIGGGLGVRFADDRLALAPETHPKLRRTARKTT